jgi:ribosomal-protein-alanine N-acetyltransferase
VDDSIARFPDGGIATTRTTLRLITSDDAAALLRYHLENRAHLSPWEPLRAESFFTLAAMNERIRAMREAMVAGTALPLLIELAGDGGLIGECSFTHIVRGPFLACYLGFSIASSFEGKGLMREAVVAAVQFMFEGYGLHRIMANYRPDNLRSKRLLDAAGFREEGFARSYLKINGVWHDHVLTSKINPSD